MADALPALLAASTARTVLLVAIWVGIALGVFVHATWTGNGRALLWGLAALVFPVGAAVIYVARVWWNAGGKRHFTPR